MKRKPTRAKSRKRGMVLPGSDGEGWAHVRRHRKPRRLVRILIRLVFGLFICGLLAGAVWLGLRTLGRNPTKLLAQSVQAEQQGDLAGAEKFMREYLAAQPGDNRAMVRRGALLLKLATTSTERSQALQVFEVALAREPDQPDLRRQVGRLAMDLEKFRDARRHWEILLKANPRDGDLHELVGQCYEAENLDEQAAEHYAEAVVQARRKAGRLRDSAAKTDIKAAKPDPGAAKQVTKPAPSRPSTVPDDPPGLTAFERYAYLLRQRLRDPKRADEVMDQLVAANPESSRAYLARARYRRLFGVDDGAADIARARELAPDDREILLAIARDPVPNKASLDEQSKDLEAAIAAHPEDSRLYLAQANLEEQQGATGRMLAILRRGIERAPQDDDLRWRLLDVLMQGEQWQAATGVIGQLRKSKPDPLLPKLLDAHVEMIQSQWSAAAQALETLRPNLLRASELRPRAVEVDLRLAQCYERLLDDTARADAYRRAVSASPGRLAARLGLAEALVDLGKAADALPIFCGARVLVPETQVRILQLFLADRLRVSKDQRRWKDVEQELEAAKRMASGSPQLPLVEAEVRVAQGQLKAARKLLEQARDRDPKRVELWVALAEVAARQEQPPAALPILDAAEQRLGDRVEVRLARANYWLRRGGDEALAALAKLEAKAEGFSREDLRRLLSGLAFAYAQLGATRDAGRLWTQLAQQHPQDLSLRITIFDRALQAGDQAAAQTALDAIGRLEGENGTWTVLCGLRLLLAQTKRGDKSEDAALSQIRRRADELGARRTAWADLSLFRAELGERTGDLKSAVVHYNRALELGWQDSAVMRRAIELMYANHRYGDVEELLKRLPDQSPLTSVYRLSPADLALEVANKAVAAGSRDFRDHFWLGQVLRVMSRNAEAETALRKAVTLAPDEPAPRVALVEHLTRMGMAEQAQAAVRDAEGPLSRLKPPLALARCYELAGRDEEAEKLYRAVLAEAPKAPLALRFMANWNWRKGQISEAETQMRSLMAMQDAAPVEAAWARFNLALLLSESGDYRRSQEALSLVGGADGTGLDELSVAGLDQQRARGIVLARQPGSLQRKEAIRLLEEVGGRGPARPEDQVLLAELYRQDGDWPKARAQLLSVAEPVEQKPEYLFLVARALLRREDTAEVPALLARLQKAEPGGAKAVEIEARLLHAQDKNNEAADLIEKFVRGKEPRTLITGANLLEELGRLEAAEAMVRRYGAESKEPEGILALALFLVRRERFPEALDVCDRAWQKCDAETVAAVCVAFPMGKLTDAQRERLGKWLEDAFQKNPDSPSLPFRLAYVRDLQGRARDAENLYRLSIQQGRFKAGSLNNLAMLLALQKGRAGEARPLIDSAIELAGPQFGLLDTRGVVQLGLGQPSAAVRDLEQAVALAPVAPVYFHLCQAHLAAGDRPAAVAAYQKAVAAGLDAGMLHPLERETYEKMRVELAAN